MYGFPFPVPQTDKCLDEEGITYLYVRRHKEDALVVPTIPSCASCGVLPTMYNMWTMPQTHRDTYRPE